MAESRSLEEQIAHLTRTVDELSDVVARQDQQIEAQRRIIESLQERLQGLGEAGNADPQQHEPPPHY